jgi:hypothetical protein
MLKYAIFIGTIPFFALAYGVSQERRICLTYSGERSKLNDL